MQYYYLQITTKGHVEKYCTSMVSRLRKQMVKTLKEVSITFKEDMVPPAYTLRRDIKKLNKANVLSMGIEDSLIQITKCENLPTYKEVK